MDFTFQQFFNVEHFAFKELFLEGEPIWRVITKLHTFLESLPLGKIEGEVEEGAILIHPEKIFIGKGSRVEAGAYIRGPCWIGEACEVRQGAYIRGDVITGSQCVIGHATEAKNTLFLDGAHAGHFAYLGDSILGNKVNLGAGVKCANLRLDRHNIMISNQGRRIDTGLRKLGAVIGDEAQLGCNAVTNPGTLMGKRSGCFPCVNLGGVIPEKMMVKSSGLNITSMHKE